MRSKVLDFQGLYFSLQPFRNDPFVTRHYKFEKLKIKPEKNLEKTSQMFIKIETFVLSLH